MDVQIPQSNAGVIHGKKGASVGAGTNEGHTDHAAVFRQLIRQQYSSASDAFDQFKDSSEMLSRKAFKAMINSLGMTISDRDRKLLRKRVTVAKSIHRGAFLLFADADQTGDQDLTEDGQHQMKESTNQSAAGVLAVLPPEIPTLPSSFKVSQFRLTLLFCDFFLFLEK